MYFVCCVSCWSLPIIFYVVFRVWWPREWSLNPCLLGCPCLQSLACTLSLWLVSLVQPATSLSTVNPAGNLFHQSDTAHDNKMVKLNVISWNLKNIPLLKLHHQVTTRPCLVWAATACWSSCLAWRRVAVWWRSFPPFLASSSAHPYHGQKLSALIWWRLCNNKKLFFMTDIIHWSYKYCFNRNIGLFALTGCIGPRLITANIEQMLCNMWDGHDLMN